MAGLDMEVLGYNLVVPTPPGAAHVRSAGRTGRPSHTRLFKADTEPSSSAGHCARVGTPKPSRPTHTQRGQSPGESDPPTQVKEMGHVMGQVQPPAGSGPIPKEDGAGEETRNVRGCSLAVMAGGEGQTGNNLVELREQTPSGDCQRLSTDAG